MRTTMPYTEISQEAIGPRLTVLGYVKVGGKDPRIRWGRSGPFALPTRFVEPARFEVTTREKKLKEVEKNGTRYKVDLGYVRDTEFHDREDVGNLPTELDIRLMFPEPSQNLITHFGAHSGKAWVCQGNGLEAVDLTRGKVPCTCPRLKQFDGDYAGPPFHPKELNQGLTPCKPRGVLSFILPQAERFGGFHVFKTTSYESIANLRTQLQLFYDHWGRLDGIPLRLTVYPATKSYGEGTTTQPIVTLIVPGSFETARQLGKAAAEESRQFLLAAGGAPSVEQVQEELTKEMAEEAESEGGEYFPGAMAEDPAEPTMEDRLRSMELPVLDGQPVEEHDYGPDYETVDDGEDPDLFNGGGS